MSKKTTVADDDYNERTKTNLQIVESTNEEVTEENNLYQKLIFNSSSDVLFDSDLLTNQVKISATYEKEYGYKLKRNMTPAEEWISYIHPEDKEVVIENYLNVLSSERENWKYNYRFLRADNSVAYVSTTAIILRYADGKPYRMIGAMRDNTKLKALEFKLSEEIRLKEKQIEHAAEEAKEFERSEIGKELHDNINQLLGASKMFLGMAKQGGKNTETYLGRSTELTLLAIEEIRKISKGLTTDLIKTLGLCEAIKTTIQDARDVTELKISASLDSFIEDSVNDKFKVNVLRIFQEQLNNILKHANATEVIIKLTQNKKHIILYIEDNGAGFDPLKENVGIGIVNIKSRVVSFNGTVNFRSEKGKGCVLIVKFNTGEPLLNKYSNNNLNVSVNSKKHSLLHHLAFEKSMQPSLVATASNGQIKLANSAACKLLGYSKKDLLKKTTADIVDVNENRFKKMFQQRIAEGHTIGVVTFIKNGGQRILCEVTSVGFMNEDNVEKVIVTFSDIGYAILKQKNLDEKRNKVIANNIEIAISKQKIIDIQNAKVVADDIVLAISHQIKIDIVNAKVVADDIAAAIEKQKIVDAENAKVVADDIASAISKQKIIDVENARAVSADIFLAISKQEKIDTEKTKAVAADIATAILKQKKIDIDNNNIVAENIMEAKAISDAGLAHNNEKYLEAAKLSVDIIWDWDLATDELFMGPGYEEAFGYKVENYKIHITDWSIHLHPDDKKIVEDSLNDAILSTENHWEKTYRFIRADGTVARVADKASIIRDSTGKAYRIIGAAQDITDKKRLEVEKELIITELLKSNADLKQFSYIISHNLRSPLSNIKALLNFINYTGINEDNIKMLKAVNTSANQLSKTIDDLTNILVIKGTLNAEMKLIHLPDAFSNLYKIFFSVLNEIGAKVITDFFSTKIFFNETYLESILINLFSNAIKYRADDRKLLIQVSSKNDEAGNTILRFSDNGSGIDLVRHKERLFGLYQRFHEKVDGHGLGLYIIKSQIEALNGKIEIESEPNIGTTFIITFKKQLK